MTQSTKTATVGDRMALEPIVIRADATLTEAAALMDHRHVHGLQHDQRVLHRAAPSGK